MGKWEELQNRIIAIVDRQDESVVRLKPYAQTYARHILANLGEGRAFGYSDKDATKTQLLYVLSNMEGAPESELREIQSLAKDAGIDVSGIVEELLGSQEDDDQ